MRDQIIDGLCTVLTEYDPIAQVWVGHAPWLDVRSQGETEDEARLATEDAVRLLVEHGTKAKRVR